MKKILFATALLMGTAAYAQGTTQPGTDETTTADRVVETNVTDGSPPERDARGIPVISAPAVVPPGANQMASAPAGAQLVPAPNQSAVFSTRPATGEYPICSRTVTDGCVQDYEGRGRRRR